jgi:hypothetical protein
LKTFLLAQRLLKHFLTQIRPIHDANDETKNKATSVQRKLTLLQAENRRLKRLLQLQQNSRQLLQQIDPNFSSNEEPNGDACHIDLGQFECVRCSKCFRTQSSLHAHETLRHTEDNGNGALMQRMQEYSNSILAESKPLHQLNEQVQRLRNELQQTREKLEDERTARLKLQFVIQEEVCDKLSSLQQTWMAGDMTLHGNRVESSEEEQHDRTDRMTDERVTHQSCNIASVEAFDAKIKNDPEQEVDAEQADRMYQLQLRRKQIKMYTTNKSSEDKMATGNDCEDRTEEAAKSEPAARPEVIDESVSDSRPNSRLNEEEGKRMEEIVLRQGEMVSKLAQDVQLLVTALNSSLSVGANVAKQPEAKPKVRFLDRLAQIEVDARIRKEEKRHRNEEENRNKMAAKEAKKREKEARKMLLKLKSMPVNSASLEQLAMEMERNQATNESSGTRNGADLKGRPKGESMSSVDLRSLSLHQFSTKANDRSDNQFVDVDPSNEKIETSQTFESSHGSINSLSTKPKWTKMFKSWSPKFKRSKSTSNLTERMIENVSEETEVTVAPVASSVADNATYGLSDSDTLTLTTVPSTDTKVKSESNVTSSVDSRPSFESIVKSTSIPLPDLKSVVSPAEYEPPAVNLIQHIPSNIDDSAPTSIRLQRTPSPVDFDDDEDNPTNRLDPLDRYLQMQKTRIRKPPRKPKLVVAPLPTISQMDELWIEPMDESQPEVADEHRPVIRKGVLKKSVTLGDDSQSMVGDLSSNLLRKAKRISFNEQTTEIDVHHPHLPSESNSDTDEPDVIPLQTNLSTSSYCDDSDSRSDQRHSTSSPDSESSDKKSTLVKLQEILSELDSVDQISAKSQS